MLMNFNILTLYKLFLFLPVIITSVYFIRFIHSFYKKNNYITQYFIKFCVGLICVISIQIVKIMIPDSSFEFLNVLTYHECLIAQTIFSLIALLSIADINEFSGLLSRKISPKLSGVIIFPSFIFLINIIDSIARSINF